MTKTALLAQVTDLTSQLEKANQERFALNQFANNQIAILSTIDKTLTDAPFLNEKGKFFKKLFWVLSNLSIISSTFETIFNLISQWREYFNKVTAPPPEPAA